MDLRAPSLPSPLALGLALAAGLSVLGVLFATAPEAAPWVALGLSALGVAVLIASVTGVGPATRFVVLVALSVAALGSDDGADAFEVVFGLGLLLYVAAWYAATVLSGRRLLRNAADVAMLAFLVASGVGGIALALMLGHSGMDFRADVLSLFALALFFPAREVVVRTERGPELLAACILALGVLASIISAVQLQTAFTEATAYYEIVDARVTSGEVQAMTALVIALLWASATRSWRQRLLLLGVAVIVLGGLVIARSRAQWLSAVIGLVVAGVVVSGRVRGRLLPTVVFGAAAGAVAGIAFLGERLTLFVIGLVRRFTSISSSFTMDISLLNRYLETDAAWHEVLRSPVVGYGWGAPVTRYDAIGEGTLVWSFLHNGYVWILHKSGLIGLLLFMTAYVGIGVQGALSARIASLNRTDQALAAGGTGVLVASLALALPANPWAILDQIFILTLTLGLVSGVAARARIAREGTAATEAPESRPAPEAS